jgi:PAS domain S-box-containing protein
VRLPRVPNSGVMVAALIFTLGLFALIGLDSYLNGVKLQAATESLERTYQVIGKLELVLSTLKDAETGQRGYLLTGDERYLEPYDSARAAIDGDIGSLRGLLHDSPGELESLERVRSLSAQKLAELHESIEIARTRGLPAGAMVVRSGQGKAFMDDLRRIVGAMMAREREGLSRRQQEAQLEQRKTLRLLALWAPSSWILLGALAVLLLRQLKRQDGVMPPVGQRRTWMLIGTEYLYAGAIVIFAAVIRAGLGQVFDGMPPYITFYPAVLLAVVLLGAGPGILAVLLSTLCVDYFFLVPVGSFAVSRPTDLVSLTLFIVTNVALCLLSERMRQSEWVHYRQLRALLDGVAGFAIFMTSPEGVVSTWNAGAESLKGYSAREILGRPQTLFYSQEDIAAGLPRRALDAAKQFGEWRGEGWRLRKDSSRFWASVSITALRDRRGKLVGFAKITTDASARKILEDRLAASAERYRMLVEDQTELISLITAEGTIRFVNEAFARFFDRSVSNMLGTSFYDTVAKGERETVREQLQSVRTSQGPIRSVNQMLSPTGDRRWVEWTHRRIPNPKAEDASIHSVGRDITARKAIEDELTRVNERFAVAAEAAGLGFWEFDVLANTSRWDAQMFRLYGRTPEEREQPYDVWASTLHPEDRPAAERGVAEAARGLRAYEGEFRIVRPGGEIRYIRTASEIKRDDTGRPITMYGVNFDVTESRRADEQFRLALEAASAGMMMVDAGGAITLINAQIEVLFGYTREELIGQRLEKLLPERFRTHHPGLRQAYCVDPRARAMGAGQDLYGLTKSGIEFPVEIGLNPIHTSTGQVIVASIIDITDRQRAESFRRQMADLVESAEDGIVAKDLNGIVLSWNPGAEHLLGYRAEEIIGQPVRRLIPESRQDEETRILEQIRQGRPVAHFETVRRRRDGSLIDVSLTISPIRDHSGAVVGASKIMRDITSRKRHQEELVALNRSLEEQVLARTVELKERESLLQEVHHRVKNNLQVISSLINMQIRGLKDTSSRMALSDCQTRVQTMAQIHEMLYQSKNYAQVPFAKYAKDLTARVLSASGDALSAVSLQYELEDMSLPVETAIPCGLILNELVGNALKHAFPGGATGTIRVGLRTLPDRLISLSVSDDGIGIAHELNIRKLNSLGMQLVETLVGQIEGHLEIVRHQGTTFRITFPAEATT